MSTVLRRGVRPLSWARVVPQARHGARNIQIRAAASEQPSGQPIVSTPSSIESRGMSLGIAYVAMDR